MSGGVDSTLSLVVSVVSLCASCGLAVWSKYQDKALEGIKAENEKKKAEAARQAQISRYVEPLLRATFDLQSRIYNIVGQNFLMHLRDGTATDRSRTYAVENTCFLVAQFLGWGELVRRDVQFVDLNDNSKTLRVVRLQDRIHSVLASDRYPSPFLLFAGEQREIGEMMIVRGTECVGYGSFLKDFPIGSQKLLDVLRSDIQQLASPDHLKKAAVRLRDLQIALIDLLNELDPGCIRFVREKRTKLAPLT